MVDDRAIGRRPVHSHKMMFAFVETLIDMVVACEFAPTSGLDDGIVNVCPAPVNLPCVEHVL